MKRLFSLIVASATAICSVAAGNKQVFDITLTRDASRATELPTHVMANTDVLCQTFGYTTLTALEADISAKKLKLLAWQPATRKTSASSTYGNTGFWFNDQGSVARATSSSRHVACKYDWGMFCLTHNPATATAGAQYDITEMFVLKGDTVQYNFHLTLTDQDRVLYDSQPPCEGQMKGRPDRTDTWSVKPLVACNDLPAMPQNYIQVQQGDRITLDITLPEGATPGRFTWKDRKGKTLQKNKANTDWVIDGATEADAGYYVVEGTYRLNSKTRTFSNCCFYVDVMTQPLGTPYSWDGVIPQFSHDWKSDKKYNYGVFEQPTKILGDVPATDRYGKPTQWVEGEWWAVCWGSDLNKEVGPSYDSPEVRKCAENMVKKYDEDFAYIRDHMGWPPDLRARNGYKSLIYIFGSGLRCDNTPNTETGGYQGAIWYHDPATGISANWPCVWASYLPFSRFRDDADQRWSDGGYQREAMIHEGIHAIFADLGACSGSAWFHEAGNTWLQGAMNAERYGNFGDPGFLDACPFIAPFMPIECYSGWLQDGSFGGPTAQGVNMYNDQGQQICTWRNLLGGTQYGNAFPVILGEIAGKGAIPWIWRNCTDFVLKGIGTLLGDDTMRKLIMAYRTHMATFDIGGHKKGYRNVTNGNFGVTVKAEWSPYWIDVAPFRLTMYQGLTRNTTDGWMAPDTLTNPGWSGCNIIPIHVDSQASTATVEFRPEDTEMRAQLCYVTKDGTTHYSQPAHCGQLQIDITDRPANNVIFCVVANTDYIFVNDEVQRKKHWDYRIRLRQGALQVADLYTKWNLNEQTLKDASYNEATARDERTDLEQLITDLATPVTAPQHSDAIDAEGHVTVCTLSGHILHRATVPAGTTYLLPAGLRPGLYIVRTVRGTHTESRKVLVH